jgi:hypothetical protein
MAEVTQEAFEELWLQVRELQADALSKNRRLTTSTAPPSEALELDMEEGRSGDARQSVEGREGTAVSFIDVKPDALDISHSYKLNTSIWDSMLFFGHETLGPSVSIATLVSYISNFCLQFVFCYMISTYMLDPEVDEKTLDTLLKFRLSIAHNVEFADPITKQSLAQQMCNEEYSGKVHYAAGQVALLNDVTTFMKGGTKLMVIAEILFLCVIVKELDSIVQFAKAVMSLKRSESEETKVVGPVDGSGSAPHVQEIWTLRVYFAWACIIVPRLFISMFLAVTGVQFIGKTHSVDDLVLNCVAIAFVMDLDEIAFEGFAPRRLQTLINNMDPIPCVTPDYKVPIPCVAPDCKYQVPRRHIPVLWQVTKILLVLVSAFALYFSVLAPFIWQLEQVDHILCSQDSVLDFVYARNSANNIIYVAKSQSSDAWTPDQVTMLEVTNLEIESKFGWDSGILKKKAELGESPAIVIGNKTTSVNDTDYDTSKYDAIVELRGMSVEQAAGSIVCRDLGSMHEQKSYLTALQVLMQDKGGSSIKSCDDVSWHYCTQREMTQLRALCPVRCSCHVPPTYDLDGKRALAGYFQSPQGGCPQSCQAQLETENEISFVTGPSPRTKGEVGKCTDLGPDKFVSTPDDVDFHGFFTKSSAECLVDKTIAADCSALPPEAFWWLTFAAGLFEHLTADVAFPDIVTDMVNGMQSKKQIDLSWSMMTELVQWVSNGSMAQSFLDGSWSLMPGVPHPRNLTGCAYLTSFEVRSLLNTDLCSAEEYSSIRFMCPVSCGCTLGKIYTTEGTDVTEATTVFQVSNRMEDLGSCPAECVMVHPDISGDESYDLVDTNDAALACADTSGGATDSDGDSCEYWTDNSIYCGYSHNYDDSDFTTMDMCCACGGGVALSPTPASPATPALMVCSDASEDFSGGATGLYAENVGTVVSCDIWATYSQYCADYSANYDDSDFTAMDMCCACVFGAAPAPAPPVTCADTDAGARDSYDDPCDAYVADPYWCFGYDDSDFTSADMCCACGGGDK